MTVSEPYQDPGCRRRTCDWLVAVRTDGGAAVHRFPSREDADTFVADNAPVPRKPRELTTEQRAALEAARKAQRRFERAQRAVDTATDARAAAFRAALAAGITYGELASAFGWPRSSVQSAERGRESERKR